MSKTRTLDLILTTAECQHLAYTMDVDEHWQSAGGPEWRLQWLSIFRSGAEGPHMVAMTTDELWLLDTALMRTDPRGAKLPDGTLVLELLTKIWDALLEAYEKGTDHADDEDAHGYSAADRAENPPQVRSR